MSEDQNKALVRRFYEDFWGKGDLAVADQILAPDYVGAGDPPYDVDREKRQLAELLESLREGEVTVLDQVAEGDKVATRWVARLVEREEGLPQGRQVVIRGTHFHRVADGKIVEAWGLTSQTTGGW